MMQTSHRCDALTPRCRTCSLLPDTSPRGQEPGRRVLYQNQLGSSRLRSNLRWQSSHPSASSPSRLWTHTHRCKRSCPGWGQRSCSRWGQRSRTRWGQRSRYWLGQRSRTRGGQRSCTRWGQRSHTRWGQRSRYWLGQRSCYWLGQRSRTRVGQRSRTRVGQRSRYWLGQRSRTRGGQRSCTRVGQRSRYWLGQRSRTRGGQRSCTRVGQRSRTRWGQRSLTWWGRGRTVCPSCWTETSSRKVCDRPNSTATSEVLQRHASPERQTGEIEFLSNFWTHFLTPVLVCLTWMMRGRGCGWFSGSSRTLTGPSLTILPPRNTWKRQTGELSHSDVLPDHYHHWTSIMTSHLADQSGVLPVCNVILSDVTVQPITEVQETVVQWDQDVCDQTCNNRQVSQTGNWSERQIRHTGNRPDRQVPGISGSFHPSTFLLGTLITFSAAHWPSWRNRTRLKWTNTGISVGWRNEKPVILTGVL